MRLSILRNMRIGVGLWVLLSIVLTACGGGGGSSTSTTTPTTTTPTSTPTTAISVTPFKGKFSSGTVVIKDSTGTTVGTGTIGSNGIATVNVQSTASYPLLTEVTGTYLNENTGANETSTVPLRSIVPDAGTATNGIAVSAITELAVSKLAPTGSLTGVNAASASAAITAAASVLGMTYNEAMAPPVFDTAGKTDDPVTMKLAALAVALNGKTGATLVDKIKTVATNLSSGTAIATEIPQATLDAAIAAVNGGAKSMLATPTTVIVVAVTVPTTTLDTAVTTATAAATAANLVADHYIADATSASGVHEPWITGLANLPMADYARKFTAGSAGAYSQSISVKELNAAGTAWSTKTPSTETYLVYYINATTAAWTIPSGNLTWQRNADGSLTVTRPDFGTIRMNIVETDVSGQAIVSQFDGATVLGTYPAGSVHYTQQGAVTSQGAYRIFDDPWSLVTDGAGNNLSAMPNIGDTVCSNGTVMKPIFPTPATGDTYEVFFTAGSSDNGCSAAEINAALAAPAAGTATLGFKPVGTGTVTVGYVASSANLPGFMQNQIIGAVNGKVLSGSYKAAGKPLGFIFDSNQTAANAEIQAHFASAPAL